MTSLGRQQSSLCCNAQSHPKVALGGLQTARSGRSPGEVNRPRRVVYCVPACGRKLINLREMEIHARVSRWHLVWEQDGKMGTMLLETCEIQSKLRGLVPE